MDSKISIIVPVYNVEEYVEKCILSLINQTYQNLEIILVDDGSTDRSGSICDLYSKKDYRIKVIHKNNGGLSDARNCGLKESTGDFVCFIDSDDYIELDILESMVMQLITDNSDICCCAKVLDYAKNKIILNNGETFCVDNVSALKRLLINDDIDNSACDKLFRRKLFDNIVFPIGRYYEDIATTYKLFIASKKVSHINKIGYHYVIRNNSISTETFSKKQLDAVIFTKQAKDDIVNLYSQLKYEAEAYYFLELMTTLRKIKRASNFIQYKYIYFLIKKEYNLNFKKILKNKFIPKYKKVMGCFIYLNLFDIVELIYGILSKKR